MSRPFAFETLASRMAPEPLSVEDLAILRLESDTVAGHTLKIAILDPPASGPRPDVEALRARVAAGIERAPRLRRRLEMRSGRRAAWVDYPAFDVRDHVRAARASRALPHDDVLRHVCARMMEERLDRGRPLWTIDLLDPLEDGSIAVIWRLHHSMADGAMAMGLAERLLWDAPDGVSAGNGGSEHRPSLAQIRDALEARRPRRLPGTVRRELRMARNPSPFDGVVGTSRVVAFASVRLGRLRRTAKRLVPGATVNDAVLTLVGGGLRRWAEAGGDRLESLRVKIPVSLHQHAESPATANRESFFCVALPLGEPDAVERLRRITEETALRKRARDPLVIDTLLRDAARLAPPLRHLLEQLTLHPRAFALNVSNVVGPRRSPFLLGAPVRALYSIADVDERHGLRVAVISMADELQFGLCADPAIVGELEPLVDGIRAEDAALAACSRGSASNGR